MFNCLIASLRHPQRHGLRYVVRIGTTRKANRNNYWNRAHAHGLLKPKRVHHPGVKQRPVTYRSADMRAGNWSADGKSRPPRSWRWQPAGQMHCLLFVSCGSCGPSRGKATSAFLHICFKGVLQMGTQNASPGLLGLDADSLLGKCIVCSLCLVSCVSCVSRVTNWQAS